MFSSESYIDDINIIPTQWILQNYLKLPYKLTGQTVKIKSLFNTKDRDPSMVFYWYKNRYIFKDFSSGNKGGVIDAMMVLFNKPFIDTSNIIKNDYLDFIKEGNVEEKINIEILEYKWAAKEVVVRKWNTNDVKYWTKHNASSDLLGNYCIKPLKSYTLSKIEVQGDVELESFTTNVQEYVYGYFKQDGSLYKIYRPFWKNKKFMTIDSEYIQGTEQLVGFDYLGIASSMKDLIVLKSLKLKVDFIAPNSENTTLSDETIEFYKTKYKAIFTLFDPDDAGIKAMKEYEKRFKIPFCYVPYKNNGDIADMMKDKGLNYTLYNVVPPLNRAIEKYLEIHKKEEYVVL